MSESYPSTEEPTVPPEVTSGVPLHVEEEYYDYDNGREEYYGSHVHVYFGLMLTIGGVGVLANSLSLAVILGTAALRKQISNVLIVNQSICDLLASLTLIATHLTSLTSDGLLEGMAGEVLCRLFISETLFWLCFSASAFNLVALTFERYLMVVFTLKHRIWFNRKFAYVLIFLTWLTAVLFNVATFVTTQKDGAWCAFDVGWPHKMDDAFYVVTFIGTFLFPLVLLVYGYSHILLVLCGRNGMISKISKNTNNSNNDDKMQKLFTKAQLNMTKTMLVVFLAFIVCLLPHQIYYTCYELIPLPHNSVYYYVLLCINQLNCVIDPFIYCFTFTAFQRGARRMFCCCQADKPQTPVSMSTVVSTSSCNVE